MLTRSLLITLLAAALISIVTLDHILGCIDQSTERAMLAGFGFHTSLFLLAKAGCWRDVLMLVSLGNPYGGFNSFHSLCDTLPFERFAKPLLLSSFFFVLHFKAA